MKKPAFWNTPAGILITVSCAILGGEFLIMLLIESIHATLLKDAFLEKLFFEFLDPVALTAIVSPAIYLLIFRPMRAQQSRLEQQLDELRSFQRLSIGRELRMKELVSEITALRNPLSVEPTGDIPVTDGSLEAPRDAAAQHVTTQQMEESQRSALLFMLEDLEAGRKKIELAYQEWIAALDAVDDPIFLHDKQFRILRVNLAYQKCAGIPFKEIIGRHYWEVFPKGAGPTNVCTVLHHNPLQGGKEKIVAEEELTLPNGETFFCRIFIVHNAEGGYLFSMHVMENVTERKRAEVQLKNSEERHRQIIQTSMDGFWITDTRGASWM